MQLLAFGFLEEHLRYSGVFHLYIRTSFPDIHGFTEQSFNDSFRCFQLSSWTGVTLRSSQKRMGTLRNVLQNWLASYVESCGENNSSVFLLNRALLSVDSLMLFWMKSNTSLTRWETPEAS